MNEQTNEWINNWMNEQTNEWTNTHINGKTNEQTYCWTLTNEQTY